MGGWRLFIEEDILSLVKDAIFYSGVNNFDCGNIEIVFSTQQIIFQSVGAAATLAVMSHEVFSLI